ncbi:GNAT family N-acetyltransferase [Oceanobacillus sp. FSL W7-1293]|uniref:GNAT family N-acetyltransferase n=1 Tax=Oceanobacillus TaxID=182709 RepID=UPI0030CE07DE
MELLTAAGDVNEENKSNVFNANQVYFREKLSNGKFTAWLAEDKGKIVAISGLVFFDRPPQGENISGIEAYVMNMYTKPNYRSLGIARTLLEECISHCENVDVGRI